MVSLPRCKGSESVCLRFSTILKTAMWRWNFHMVIVVQWAEWSRCMEDFETLRQERMINWVRIATKDNGDKGTN